MGQIVGKCLPLSGGPLGRARLLRSVIPPLDISRRTHLPCIGQRNEMVNINITRVGP